MKKQLISIAVVACALFTVPTAAIASERAPQIVEGAPGGAKLDPGELATKSELNRLAGTQSRAEIERLKALGLGTAVLVDGDTGEELAAVHAKPDAQKSRAISILVLDVP
jgi:hypothetical protein